MVDVERCTACGAVRYAPAVSDGKPFLGSPEAVYELIGKRLGRAKQERMIAIYLDAQNRPIGKPLTVSVGELNTVRTHPRELLEPALKRRALSLIIAHNHPSGNLEPSADDLSFTDTVGRACATLGIRFLDHLVVSKRGFTSIRARSELTRSAA